MATRNGGGRANGGVEGSGTVHNLSFEREFGKIIAEQDTMAKIVAEKTNRSIAHVIQTLATVVFLPL